jgi:hypothetical protein
LAGILPKTGTEPISRFSHPSDPTFHEFFLACENLSDASMVFLDDEDRCWSLENDFFGSGRLHSTDLPGEK